MKDGWLYTTGAVAGVFLCLLLAERRLPLRKASSPFFPRLFLNLLVSASAFATAALMIRPVVARGLDWSSAKPFGLLHLFEMPAMAQFLLGFLLMDLSFYYWHVANHRIGFLWRFHNVHHSDPDLDVSTGFRFHFGEVALSAGFRAVQVTAIGLSPWTYAVYELVFQVNTAFHHSNLKLPIQTERLLNWILVTPRMHGIHHSQVRDETNSNYSVVFSWWDRMHRSISLHIPQSSITIGVPGYSRPEDNRFWNTICMPFRRQREYWKRPDGTTVPTQNRSHNKRGGNLAE